MYVRMYELPHIYVRVIKCALLIFCDFQTLISQALIRHNVSKSIFLLFINHINIHIHTYIYIYIYNMYVYVCGSSINFRHIQPINGPVLHAFHSFLFRFFLNLFILDISYVYIFILFFVALIDLNFINAFNAFKFHFFPALYCTLCT